jgi:ComF family protein
MKCGGPVEEGIEFCRECEGRSRAFDGGKSIYVYDDRMKASLMQFKYYGRREYGAFYARALCVFGEKEVRRWNPDLILPIPLHKKKQRQRGFNQAQDLAVRVGETLGIPVETGILKKIRHTKSQKKLDAAQRRRNLEDAFAVTESLDGLNILLIDDVYTTGSTVEAAALCLKKAGAQKVYFLTLCRALQVEKAGI